ncbi:MAG: AMP-binding protein [Solirubrobacterales bacterium]|nr:AMP-binding protein [Solirubrobacterales bacterium]
MIARGTAGTRFPYAPTTLHALLDETAAAHGERDAIVFGERRLTWEQARRRARELACGLLAAGVRPGDHVAVWVPNHPEWVLLWFACSMVGAVVVPVNTRYKAEEVGFILGQSDAAVLVLVPEFAGIDYLAMLARLRGLQLPALRRVVVIGESAPADAVTLERFVADGAAVAPDALDATAAERDESDPTIIVYTSGTTGHPKGAVHTHRILRNERSIAQALDHDADSRVMNHLPFFHVGGGFTGILPPLITGGAMILMDQWDPTRAFELIEAERVTVLSGIPTHFIDLLGHPGRERYDVSSLRTGWIGGANNPPELIAGAIEKLGMDGLLPVYGMTETTSITCIPRLGDPREVVIAGKGFPVSDIEVKVVDTDSGAELDAEAEGEVCQRGHHLMEGYYRDPEATAAVIDSDGWFHTGDLGVLDPDGYLSITGRKSDMFIVGGANAYPAEIESALAEHPDIQQAYVVGVPDQRLGEIGHAFVEARAGAALEPEAVMAFCRDRLADYKVPRRVEFVTEWPLTPTGKIQRFRLRELAAERVAAPP